MKPKNKHGMKTVAAADKKFDKKKKKKKAYILRKASK